MIDRTSEPPRVNRSGTILNTDRGGSLAARARATIGSGLVSPMARDSRRSNRSGSESKGRKGHAHDRHPSLPHHQRRGVSLLVASAKAQGVAFQPVVGAIPNGPTLGVTPAVSIDRRYVRLGVNSQFLAVEGFNTYLVPGAVTGGPGGPVALGGVGLRGVGGEQFMAGMDGAISPAMGFSSYDTPSGYGFAGYQGPANIAPPALAAMPAGPQVNARLRRGPGSRKSSGAAEHPLEAPGQHGSAGHGCPGEGSSLIIGSLAPRASGGPCSGCRRTRGKARVPRAPGGWRRAGHLPSRP